MGGSGALRKVKMAAYWRCVEFEWLCTGYILSLQIATGVSLVGPIHEHTKNLEKTVQTKIARRLLLMARRIIAAWSEHADVEQTADRWFDQVKRL